MSDLTAFDPFARDPERPWRPTPPASWEEWYPSKPPFKAEPSALHQIQREAEVVTKSHRWGMVVEFQVSDDDAWTLCNQLSLLSKWRPDGSPLAVHGVVCLNCMEACTPWHIDRDCPGEQPEWAETKRRIDINKEGDRDERRRKALEENREHRRRGWPEHTGRTTTISKVEHRKDGMLMVECKSCHEMFPSSISTQGYEGKVKVHNLNISCTHCEARSSYNVEWPVA